MKERVVAAIILVLLAQGAAGRHDEAFTRGVPAPPPQSGHVRRRLPNECPQPICPEPVCPEPVCPQPQCPSLPPIPKCPPPAPAPKFPPCPNLSCPKPVCPQPKCPTLPAFPTCPPPAPAPTIPPCPNLSCPLPVCPAPTCPQPACPPAVCPKPSCPALSAPSVTTCPAKGASCSDCLWKVLVNYDHFQGFGFYKAYKTKVNWHQAKALCAADGGHLGIINSEKEAELFKLLYRKNELTDWVFLGFHDLNEENNFETVMGEPLSKTGYMKWRRGQPDNAGNEDCGTIDQNAFFNDVKCDWKSGFICEVHEKNALGQ